MISQYNYLINIIGIRWKESGASNKLALIQSYMKSRQLVVAVLVLLASSIYCSVPSESNKTYCVAANIIFSMTLYVNFLGLSNHLKYHQVVITTLQ